MVNSGVIGSCIAVVQGYELKTTSKVECFNAAMEEVYIQISKISAMVDTTIYDLNTVGFT